MYNSDLTACRGRALPVPSQVLGLDWARPVWADATSRALWDGEREPLEIGDGAVSHPSPGSL